MRRHLCFLALSLCVFAGAQAPPDDALLMADGLFARGFYEMALREYEALLRDHPQFPGRDAVLFRAAESARQLDQPMTARRHYLETLTEAPGGEYLPRALLRLADMALEAQEYPQARRHAQSLLRSRSEPAQAAAALHILGTATREMGDLDEARNVLTQLVQTYPRDPHAAYAALMLERMEPRGNSAERRRWLEAALVNPPSPDLEVEALWGLGQLDLDENSPAAAADRFFRLWRLHPDHPRVQLGSLTIAWTLLTAERFDEALDVSAHTPRRRKEEQADTWGFLEAAALRKLDRKPEALARYASLLRDHPGTRFRGRIAFDLALLHFEAESFDRVLELEEDLLTQEARREDVLWMLAESGRQTGRTEEAMERYRQITALTPPGIRAADASFQLALLLRRGDPGAAASAMARFAAHHPEDPRAFQALRAAGGLWAELNQSDTARRVWLQALARYPADPGRPELEYQLGMLELREGQSNAARTFFEQVLAHVPEAPRAPAAAHWIAMIAHEADDPEAVPLLRSALAREPGGDQERNLRLRLATRLESAGSVLEAVELLEPLLADPLNAGLTDQRLVWLLSRARSVEKTDLAARVAEAMIQSGRSAAVRELGHYGRAELAFAAGDTDTALAHWRKGLALGSRTVQAARAALQTGEILLARGDLQEAEPLLHQALRLGSLFERGDLSAPAMMQLGHLHAARGEWEQAARQYLGLAVLYDDPALSPDGLHRAAAAFGEAGRTEDAARARAELLERYPSFIPVTP